ncbi:putative proline-rich receptor-like protein kinase PERK6 isoform X2 [Hevea brasiliensis]|uniref:putative proline-rich receptor-like protein kinase PERK6 isoform X2 n=1 Tax=Hevea brasiliensis TaxID=3981 RepID=UPI0025F51087|nr:putative proline-rich receptor-like protein kinase PERK6 isoform X2 [Hevea brasiliensis]
MGCFLSKNSTQEDQRTDTGDGSKFNAQQSAPSSLHLSTGSQSSFPRENQRYGQRQSAAPSASQNYEGYGQRQSASSSSFPEEIQSHAPVSQNYQVHRQPQLPKTTDGGTKSPVIDLIASSSSSFPEENQSHAPASENDRRYELKKYSYNELAMATDHFSNNEFLGEGAFGQVYRGTLDGKVVAIKKLKIIQDHEQPENLQNQLEEIDVLSIVRHQNVVKLVGYCNEGRNRLLVLEYVPNRSLKFHLHGKKLLEWSIRMKVAIGSAKGLQYLHEELTFRWYQNHT